MAKKTPKQQQRRHDEDSYVEECVTTDYVNLHARDTNTNPIDVMVAARDARLIAYQACLDEIKRLADESDAHGSMWERILTKRVEALL